MTLIHTFGGTSLDHEGNTLIKFVSECTKTVDPTGKIDGQRMEGQR